MKYLLPLLLLISLTVLMVPNAFAENVPDWVKNTSGWWATDVISETEFVKAIEHWNILCCSVILIITIRKRI